MLLFAYEVVSEQDVLHLRVDSQVGLISADLPRFHSPHTRNAAHQLGGGGSGGGGGGSGDVSKHIAAGHRISTRATYVSRGHIFRDWCSRQGTNPLTTTAPVVEDFLTYLFEVKHLAVAAITGYGQC